MGFYAPKGIKNLTLLTGYTVDDLHASTFSYLTEAFLGQYDYLSSYKWLKPSLKNFFSFCPICVRQYKYHSLVWRFRENPGCPEHGIKLVDRCYLCGALLPLPSVATMLGLDNAHLRATARRQHLCSQDYADAQDFDDRLCFYFRTKIVDGNHSRSLHDPREIHGLPISYRLTGMLIFQNIEIL
jgi:hypothetical protein